MPVVRTLGAPRIKLRRIYTFGTQDFLVLTANRVNGREDEFHGPKHPYNAQYTHYNGEPGWVRLEVRKNDRPWGDSTAVDRIGLDGWIDPMPNGDRVLHVEFEIVFGDGCAATAEAAALGQVWLNFFETHCKKLPDITEFDGAGPVGMHYEWSSGGARPVFRIYFRHLILDAYGIATGNTQEIIFEASSVTNPDHQIIPGVKQTFEIDLYAHETDGFLHIKKNGVLIVDKNSEPVGYGPERRIYPQLRMYRATRLTPATLMNHPLDISYPKVPPIPGVTRGQELVPDGQFTLNRGRFLDINSNVDCGLAWESDGAGGGLMRAFTTGSPPWADLDKQARFKRRLDILEVGETYELKQRGTFPIGAAPTDGGYFDPATRYLPPMTLPAGAEVVRQFVATSETVFIGGSSPINGAWVTGISLKRVIV